MTVPVRFARKSAGLAQTFTPISVDGYTN